MTQSNSLCGVDAAVVCILGQSNAHAHDQPLPPAERITLPLRNVFAPDRRENQRFDLPHVTWRGFTTAGYNLGETQDHTCSLACYLASAWQRAIDRGQRLPDLYLVQLSIGAQGVVQGMWREDYPRVLRPGALGEVEISLLSFAEELLPKVWEDLSQRYQNPLRLGCHWLGGEEDTLAEVCSQPDFDARYDRFFDRLTRALGGPCPLYLYLPVCSRRQGVTPKGLERVRGALRRQQSRFAEVHLIQASDSPFWDEKQPAQGVFAEDQVHYLPKTQAWFCRRFLSAAGISLPTAET